MLSTQSEERDARLLAGRGDKLGALRLVWDILNRHPRSPVSSLGFKICRELQDWGEADRLRAYLEQQQTFNDQAKLDWILVQVVIGQRARAAVEIRELLSTDKSIAFRLHVAKSLSAQGLQLTSDSSASLLELIGPTQAAESVTVPESVHLFNDASLVADDESDQEFDSVGAVDRNELEHIWVNDDEDDSDTPGVHVDVLVAESRRLSKGLEFEQLRDLYLKYRFERLAGQREYFMTMLLKSISQIAKVWAQNDKPLPARRECVELAELVFGDLLARSWRLLNQQFVPMIECHLSADLPRSAEKYLKWNQHFQPTSFQYHLWPFVRYIYRRQDVDGLLAFLEDCESIGAMPDAHAVALVARALNSAQRFEKSLEFLERYKSRGIAVDSHTAMAALYAMAKLNRQEDMPGYLREVATNYIPDARTFDFVCSRLYLKGRFSLVREVLDHARQLGIWSEYLDFRFALNSASLGDWSELIYLLSRFRSFSLEPQLWNEVFVLLRRHDRHDLHRELCEQSLRAVKDMPEAKVLTLAYVVESQLRSNIFSRESLITHQQLVLLRELLPNSPIIAVVDLLSRSEELEIGSVGYATRFQEKIGSDSGIVEDALHDMLLSACSNARLREATWLLEELIKRKQGTAWHLARLLNDFSSELAPERIEELYSLYHLKVNDLSEESHRVLFNILARVYQRAGKRDDVMRVVDAMRDLGIEEDEFTLRELLGISPATPTSVGVLLRATDSLDFEALRRVLDDLRHELSHFVAQVSLHLQTATDAIDKVAQPGALASVQTALDLTRSFSQRIEGYSDIADPNMSGICNFSEVLEEVVSTYVPLAREQGVKIVSKPNQLETWLAISSYGIRTVLQNLLDNSLSALRKSQPEEPRIWINVIAQRVPRPGDLISISIRDNGEGIPDEIAEQIFARGFTTRSGHGFGLGLALVRSIIESVEGTIQLAQGDGQPGAHFLIQLRISEAPNE